MPSKQFEHLQESSLRRLQAMVPHDCPLIVMRWLEGGFTACSIDRDGDGQTGRYQLVATWINGYVTAWERFAQYPVEGAEASRRDAEQPRRAAPHGPSHGAARRG